MEVEVYMYGQPERIHDGVLRDNVPSGSKVVGVLRQVNITGGQTKSDRDILNTIINITKRRHHHIRCNPQHILHNLLPPPKLRNNLLTTQRRQTRMTPHIYSNPMPLQVLALQITRELETARSDDEGGVEGLGGEVGEEVGGVEGWSVVVG